MSQTSVKDALINELRDKYPEQKEFIQAVENIGEHIVPVFNANEHYKSANILRRLSEPERIISFRVDWINDNNEIESNRGWRVQFNSLIGPYKGGLRFHPSVNLSILKFLAYEQCFKNALTGLPMGGAKGGSDFNPKGRSEHEIMRFCQAFMVQLCKHIGPYTDVPAGDINVGAREIGYLYGAYRRLTSEFGGSITGKGIEFGGSHVRTEATGFGLIYFLERMLSHQKTDIAGKHIAISGAGNVALHAAMKSVELDAKVLSVSNSKGCLLAHDGFDMQAVNWLLDNKHNFDNALEAFAKTEGGQKYEYRANCKPWDQVNDIDIALPCATQNEVEKSDARAMLERGCSYVLEGANMPCTSAALDEFTQQRVFYAPGKASNAGGVAISGLEMSQNADFSRRSFVELDQLLRKIMHSIHDKCLNEGKDGEHIDYSKGASIAAFRTLADAMVAQGA